MMLGSQRLKADRRSDPTWMTCGIETCRRFAHHFTDSNSTNDPMRYLSPAYTTTYRPSSEVFLQL